MELRWEGQDLHVGGITVSIGGFARGQDPPDQLLIFKPRHHVAAIAARVEALAPRRILEVGVAQGGSTALLAALVPEARILAVDIAPPKPALATALADLGAEDRVRVLSDVDQTDVDRLTALVDEHLGEGPLDLVIDDASHTLDATRTTFNAVFPRVRPQGLYVIEDWAWGHATEIVQAEAAPLFWPQGRPLTELVFELVMSCALPGSAVARVEVAPLETVVERADTSLGPGPFDISRHYDEGPTPLLHRG